MTVSRVHPVCLAMCLALLAAHIVAAPAGDDEDELKFPPPPWAVPAYPILTVPLGGPSPTIDGRLDPEGEWRDAVALSGFLQRDLGALAPPLAQATMRLRVDGTHLYAALRTPVYPEGAQLRAFERRKGQLGAIMDDDHVLLEVLPLASRKETLLRQTGSFALVWNPAGALADLHVGANPGNMGDELWESAAEVANQVTASHWDTEVKLPLERFKSNAMERELKLPPAAGQYWSFNLARRFGRTGANLFTTWVLDKPVFQLPWDEQALSWSRRGMLRFSDSAVAVQLLDIGDPTAGTFAFDLHLANPGAAAREVRVQLVVQALSGTPLWQHDAKVAVPPGTRVAAGPLKAEVQLDHPFGSRLFIRIVQEDGQLLYLTPGLLVAHFDEPLRDQYRRSLQMLR